VHGVPQPAALEGVADRLGADERVGDGVHQVHGGVERGALLDRADRPDQGLRGGADR
jgi:hypothetical protein